LNEIIKLRWDDPQVDAWKSTTENILNETFGMPGGSPHSKTSDFQIAGVRSVRRFEFGTPESVIDHTNQARHEARQRYRKALLEAYIEQLQDLAPPGATTGPHQYVLHSEIERVSGQVYRDGHYREAALIAYIRVIEEVRLRSGLHDDGDPLMNRAFGFQNQTPVIQFNDLVTDAEKDEQRGIMFLFKGIVGLRNAKAHSIALFDDPHRGHDYLALASLLMRLLEVARYNRP
jgi:uncharacterized protein (TIGR02391 family)